MRAKTGASLTKSAAAFCVRVTRRQVIAVLDSNMSLPTEVLPAMRENKASRAQTSRRELPEAFVPATLAGIVAAVGTAGFFFIAFGPGNTLEGHGDGMISAAAAQHAGATITPSMPSR